jgi:hypothetical protein
MTDEKQKQFRTSTLLSVIETVCRDAVPSNFRVNGGVLLEVRLGDKAVRGIEVLRSLARCEYHECPSNRYRGEVPLRLAMYRGDHTSVPVGIKTPRASGRR